MTIMKNLSKLLLALAMLLALVGCVSPPTESEIANADYGAPPTGKTRAITLAFFELHLKDPSSAQYKFPETVQKYWLKPGMLRGGSTIYGYRADVMVNAKNSYGGYTGYQHYAFVIRDGRIVAYTEHAQDANPIWIPL